MKIMNELNKKLAYFAGLHRNEPTGGFWWDAEGNLIFDFHNSGEKGFTESLDACFKWLAPKLHAWTIGSCPDGDVCAVAVLSENIRGESCQKDAALALCLAIEKLIDSREDEDKS